jgi:hypothetical protein
MDGRQARGEGKSARRGVGTGGDVTTIYNNDNHL